MEFYDPSNIGSRIAWFGWNAVYHYGDREVIKFPCLELLGLDTRLAMQRDILIGKDFFGRHMLDTKVAVSPDGKKAALVQPLVRGRVLRKQDLNSDSIAEQFRDVVVRHERLIAAGHAPVDLMSGIGFLFGLPRNIFLLQDGTVRIIDVMLLDMLYRPLQKVVLQRQRAVLASYCS